MGKLFGFDLGKSRDVGNGATYQIGKGHGPVYDGGSDPNQEGRGGLSLPFGSPPFLGRYTRDYLMRGQTGGAVQTRRDRLAVDENEAAAIDAAIEESERLSPPTSTSTSRKRNPPRPPPPPTRGPVLYGDNDLQRFMAALGLNYNRQGKKTRVHQRLMGWRMHGSKAGQERNNNLSRLIRQGKTFSVLSWKAGHDDLKFPASPALLKKYYTVAHALGYLKNPAPPLPTTTRRKKLKLKSRSRRKVKRRVERRVKRRVKRRRMIRQD